MIDSARRPAHYSKLYAMPGAMHSDFMQSVAFDQEAIDNQQFLTRGKLPMPVRARYAQRVGRVLSPTNR